ncbi:MAG: DHH family phosphoesterase [Promethearchaeota archaeon]
MGEKKFFQYIEHRESDFLMKLSELTARFDDIKSNLEHILIITHTDADGYASAELVQRMATREKIQYSTKYFNRTESWRSFLNGILPEFDKFEHFAVFFTDIGSQVREISNVFKENEDFADVFILDHHETEEFSEEDIQENINIVNPTLYGYDGLKEVAGSTLVYMFTKEVSLENIKNAWIALIGISNDTLMNVAKYNSFNKMVLEEALSEEQILLCNGLVVYGATHETVKNALAHSILPFIKEIGGDTKISGNILQKINVDPNRKVVDLTEEDIKKINGRFPEDLSGKYIVFPKKKSFLRYCFEHGLAISISHFKHAFLARKLIPYTSPPTEITRNFQQYIKTLTKNLGLFVKTPKKYTNYAIFVDAKRKIPSNFWSDVASYSSVNSLYNPDKVLFLGGPDPESPVIKLGVRCSDKFPPLKEGKGVDDLIIKLRKKYGGVGGGHKLAGGYKIAPNRYRKLKEDIDELFPL